jgi:hypothetical protein
LDAAGEPDAWVAKASHARSPDADPSAFLAADRSWFTATEWRSEYIRFLRETLVVENVHLDLSPRTGIGVALLEAAVAWYAELSPGARLLLGNEDSPQARSAVEALVSAVSAEVEGLGGEELRPGRTLGDLEQELLSLIEPGGPLAGPNVHLVVTRADLAGLAETIEGFYADPSSLDEPSTTHAAAALLQGAEADAVPAAIYLVRLGVSVPEQVRSEMPNLPLLLDHLADYDGDGVANGDELAEPPDRSSDPRSPDSDGDLLPDLVDLCPSDAANLCLIQVDLEDDLDGDGVPDALEICLDTPDPLQTDILGNGVGDACRRYANIRTPVGDVTIYAGMAVRFSSIENDPGAFEPPYLPPLAYRWDMDGGAPDSSAASPGDVVFSTPGLYTIRFNAVDDAGTTSPLGPDVRVVTVLGSDPSPPTGRLASPPIWAYQGEAFSCVVSNITERPVEVIVTHYDEQGAPGTGTQTTIGPRATHSAQLTQTSDGFAYCEVEVPGWSAPEDHIRLSWFVFDSGGRITGGSGRP